MHFLSYCGAVCEEPQDNMSHHDNIIVIVKMSIFSKMFLPYRLEVGRLVGLRLQACRLSRLFLYVNIITDLRKGSCACAGVGGPGLAGGGISASQGMVTASARRYIYNGFGLRGSCGGSGVGSYDRNAVGKYPKIKQMPCLGPSSFVLLRFI